MKDIEVMAAVVYTLLVVLVALVLYAYLVRFSRWSNGWSPSRRARTWRPLEPLFAAVRAMRKPATMPAGVKRAPYLAGPVVSVVAGLTALLLLPWRAGAPPLIDWNVPLTTVLGLCAVSLFGSVMDGWASSQATERRSAYTVAVRGWAFLLIAALALGATTVVLTNSWDVHILVASQRAAWPMALFQPLGFYLFAVAMLLASPRAPQDALRGSRWLLADFHLQHSGSIAALYHLSEHVHVMVTGLIGALVYLGGWLGPGGNALPWALLKALAVVLVLEWARPRLLQRHAARTPWAIYLLLAVLNLALTIGLKWWGMPG
jgi:NADH-quinone oxidoreductase subunit H